MDPITTITTALIIAVSKLSDSAVKDAYEGLKSVISRKFGDDSKIVSSVKDVESEPESKSAQGLLSERLAAAKDKLDSEILEKAQELIKEIEALPGDQQTMQEVKIHVQGDHNIVGGRDVTVNPSAL